MIIPSCRRDGFTKQKHTLCPTHVFYARVEQWVIAPEDVQHVPPHMQRRMRGLVGTTNRTMRMKKAKQKKMMRLTSNGRTGKDRMGMTRTGVSVPIAGILLDTLTRSGTGAVRGARALSKADADRARVFAGWLRGTSGGNSWVGRNNAPLGRQNLWRLGTNTPKSRFLE
jgi:hypothetical protein